MTVKESLQLDAKDSAVTGTLGARSVGLIDRAESFERLKRTNFCYRQEILDELFEKRPDGT